MKQATCLVVCAILIVGASVASAQDCAKMNFVLKEESTDQDPANYQFLADYFGIDSFEYCWSQEVNGTLKGTWVFCGSSYLFMNDPLDLGVGPELWANPGIIITRNGIIYTMSYSLSVWDGDVFVAFGGLTRYVAGTGAYTGATGWTTDSPMKYPPTYWIHSEGILCLPE